jgi:hypothetical protein
VLLFGRESVQAQRWGCKPRAAERCSGRLADCYAEQRVATQVGTQAGISLALVLQCYCWPGLAWRGSHPCTMKCSSTPFGVLGSKWNRNLQRTEVGRAGQGQHEAGKQADSREGCQGSGRQAGRQAGE